MYIYTIKPNKKKTLSFCNNSELRMWFLNWFIVRGEGFYTCPPTKEKQTIFCLYMHGKSYMSAYTSVHKYDCFKYS